MRLRRAAPIPIGLVVALASTVTEENAALLSGCGYFVIFG
jgi:hypothetical protein